MEEQKEKKPFWKNKYFKIIVFALLTLVVPYLTIPALFVWLFQRNQKISKKVKVITYALIGTLLMVFLAYCVNAHSKDPEPTLEILSPQNNVEAQSDSIEIQGTYKPQDRTVWINGKKIQAENGSFSSSVTLKKGENKIKIQAGNWKRVTVNLTIIRVSTPGELAEQEAERKAKEEKETQEGKKKAEEESQKQAEKKAQEEQKTEAEKPFAQKEVTEESIRGALVKLEDISYSVMGENEITQIKILATDDTNSNKVVNIYFKPDSVWDEKAILRKVAGTTVEVAKRLFANPKIINVLVWVEGNFTDQYGKSSTETAVRVGLNKETADKIDWNNFRDMVLVDYNKLFDITETKYIHPAILKKL